jgi:hypothetical protein
MKYKFGTKWIAVLAPMALLLSSAVSIMAAAHTVDAGAKWEVAETTILSELTIAPGASVTAPEGRSLSMTVDGVERALKPGAYRGNIVLTPAQDIVIPYDGMGTKQNYKYRAAILIDNGAFVPAKSVSAAVTGGSVTNTAADNVKITSVGELFNGIVINGDSTYKISKPVINLIGNGKNDFAGYGAAIRAGGSSKVTIDDARIDDTGAVRTAIWVGDHSVATINNADIEVHNGVLPKDYGWSWAKGGPTGNGDVMMQVPWMLGLLGNNRATIVVGNGTAIYNNSHIKAQAWGAMSTDAVEQVQVYLNKCHVETVESGYGAYADGNSLIHSSGTTFDVADYGLVLSGGSGVFTDGSVVNSRRIGVMGWGGNKGTLTIDKGSVFNTAKAVIQLKSSTSSILIDNARLNSKSGIILEMMANDDPNQSGGGPGGGGPSAGGGPGGGPGGAAAAGGPGAGGANAKYSTVNAGDDENTTLKDATLTGDFVNSLTAKSGMNILFENSTVTGAITTATAVHDVGPNGEKLVKQDASVLYYLIGSQKETYAATSDAHGASASLDAHSSWIVDKSSYLTGLTVAPGAKISAPKGKVLTMTVDGVATPIAAGAYKGKIALQVAAGN